MDRVGAMARVRHHTLSTEKSYCYWIRKFTCFSGLKHPETLPDEAVGKFLTHLAVKENASSSTQDPALCALVFLYRHVLGREIKLQDVCRLAKRPKRLPTGLSKAEVNGLLSSMNGSNKLIATLI